MGRYVLRGGRSGVERLKILAACWEPTTESMLDRIGVGPGMTCLDVGTGGGDVAFALARRVGSTGRVVGIDLDEDALAIVRDDATRLGFANVEVRRADVAAWDESSPYDLVYSRNLLQHLPDPVAVLGSMWSAVGPGGVLAVEDADFEGGFCHPPNDGFAFWLRAYPELLRRRGGDPISGRRLVERFIAAGISDPAVDVVQRVSLTGDVKTLPALTLEATADAMVAEHVATRDEIDAAIESLDAWTADPTTASGEPRLFQCWARRPSD